MAWRGDRPGRAPSPGRALARRRGDGGGASERGIRRQTAHTSRAKRDRSVRDGDLVRDNAAAHVQL
jgi:hypothetical protein